VGESYSQKKSDKEMAWSIGTYSLAIKVSDTWLAALMPCWVILYDVYV